VGNERLRTQRKLRGWSQEDVVRGLVDLGIETGERQLGVTRSLVSRWERGVTRPRPPYPKLLCLLFQASAEDLGLVCSSSPHPSGPRMQVSTTSDEMERRELLSLLYRAASTAPVWAALPTGLRLGVPGTAVRDPSVAETLGGHPYRRLWASMPTPALMNPAVAHLNLVSQLLESSRSTAEQAKLAAAVSEAAEFVGWLAYDMGHLASGYEHYQSAAAHAERSGNDQLRACVIAGMSLWAGLLGDGARALRLIGEATSLVPPRGAPTAQAWLAAREAVAHSRVGDAASAMQALGRCERAAERSRPGEEPWPWAFPFDAARIAMYGGTVGTILAQPNAALPALQRGMDDLGPGCGGPGGAAKGGSAESGPKLRALVLCDLAETYLFAEEVEQTCLLLSEAFSIGLQMGCDRILKRVGDIRARLEPLKHVPAVRQLEDEMMTTVLDVVGTPTPVFPSPPYPHPPA
jgi:transcriptional regulator with XRE-family HTH domain